MKKYIVLFSLLLSCISNEKELSTLPILNLWEIQKQEKIIFIDELAESIELIPLETSDDILINSIREVVMYEDFMIINHDRQFSLFDLNGKFIRKIGAAGNGLGEYGRYAFEIFFIQNHFYIHKRWDDQLLKYSWEGKFIAAFDLPYVFPFITQFDENTLTGKPEERWGKERIRLYFFDLEGQLCDSIQYSPSPAYSDILDMAYVRGDISRFKETYNDTIYSITADYQLEPVYRLDLGDQSPDYDKYMYADSQPNKGQILDDYNWISTTLLFENCAYVMLLQWNAGSYIFLWDKKKNEGIRVKFYYTEELAKHFYFEKQSMWMSGKEIPVSDGNPRFKPRNVSMDGKKLIAYEQSINEDDNPILVVVTMKE